MYKFILGGAALIVGAVAVAYRTVKEDMEKEELSKSEMSDASASEASVDDEFVNTPYAESFQEKTSDFEVEPSTNETDGKLEVLLTTLEGVSKSYTNALAKENIVTFKQFMNTSDEELLAIKGIGEKSITLIREKIEAL